MVKYFHIGLHKTGTTFFQKEIFPKLNLNYNNDAYLLNLILTYDLIYVSYLYKNNSLNFNFDLISCEALSGHLLHNSINLSNVLNNIYFLYPNSKIILFIRKQDKLALSNYLQYIKIGGTKNITSLYNSLNLNSDSFWCNKSKINLSSFLFYPYIEFIVKLFGKKNLLIIPFEKFVENSDLVVDDLCTFMNCKTPKYENKIINAKLGVFRIRLFKFFNHFKRSFLNPDGLYIGIPIYLFKQKRWAHVTFRGLLNKYNYLDKWDNFINKFDPPYRDKTGTCKKILEMCKEDNKKLDKKYKLGLKKYGYY